MQTARFVKTLNATVGGLMVCNDREAKAVQKVDLDCKLCFMLMQCGTHQMRESRHKDPSFPRRNLAAAHSTCFVQIALTTCPTTNGT